MWTPIFACACGPLSSTSGPDVSCAACGVRIRNERGVFRCLDAERLAGLEPFLSQYRRVRSLDGYRAAEAGYYRALPRSAAGDPQEHVWRIRQRSFRTLCRELERFSAVAARQRDWRRRKARRPCLTVLDIGAGNGWLSNQLAALGCQTVAVDLLDDERDGLEACRHYGHAIVCVQADFDALPFASRQFDAVIFNGSVHYAPDVTRTLGRAERLLKPDGLLAVVDSPMFVREGDGSAMNARVRDRLATRYGIVAPIQPGEGFLTFERLAQFAASVGRRWRFSGSSTVWRDRVARRLIQVFGDRGPCPPRFGVWIAR